jgi:hypothetical protein
MAHCFSQEFFPAAKLTGDFPETGEFTTQIIGLLPE